MTKRTVERWRDSAGTMLLAVGVLLGLGGAGVFWYLANQRADQVQVVNSEKAAVQNAATVAEDQKNALADTALPICARPNPDAQLRALCQQALEAKSNPPAQVPAEQVDYNRVKSIVTGALASDPRLSPDALLGLVRQVYEANKPADGKTPSDQQLLDLIRRVYAENPPKDGQPGKDGTDGRPGPKGDQGEQGPQGVSVRAMRFTQDSGGACRLEVTVVDPATGRTAVLVVAVPDQLCGADPAPTTQRSPAPLLGR